MKEEEHRLLKEAQEWANMATRIKAREEEWKERTGHYNIRPVAVTVT